MAFANKNLSVIAYANGFTLWHYAEHVSLGAICTDGYFNDVRTLMNAGDIILVNSIDNTAIRRVVTTNPDIAVAILG
ncbi:MAG: hypothetical protein LBK26_00520 [Rickettsiales bacterium]|jgi:hypothetical protein|nr:hypothetical protein [Rickettsiales bacterium]